VRDTLETGRYECRVEYTAPSEPTLWWRAGRDEWESRGFWRGTVSSGPFALSVVEETPKTKRMFLPARLRYSAAERKVYYSKADAVEVEAPVTNGFFISTHIQKSRGGESIQGGPPSPDDVNGIDRLVDLPEGGELSYTIEVFETPEPPRHL
jgi:hypothetical protein